MSFFTGQGMTRGVGTSVRKKHGPKPIRQDGYKLPV